jgi:hypothetical protein
MSKKYVFSKVEFIESIKSVFKNYNELLTQVRLDFPRLNVRLNNKDIDYLEFLEFFYQKEENLLELVLLSVNQCAFAYIYEKIYSGLRERDYHLISNQESSEIMALINIQWSPIKKTITWEHTYQIMNDDMEIKKTIKIKQIMDLEFNDRIIVERDG